MASEPEALIAWFSEREAPMERIGLEAVTAVAVAARDDGEGWLGRRALTRRLLKLPLLGVYSCSTGELSFQGSAFLR